MKDKLLYIASVAIYLLLAYVGLAIGLSVLRFIFK